MAQADMDLPQRQVQSIVFGQPGGQVALGEGRRLPLQDQQGDEQCGEEIKGIAQQADTQGFGHEGLQLMRTG